MKRLFVVTIILCLFSFAGCGLDGCSGENPSAVKEETTTVTATGTVNLPAGSSFTMNDVKVHGILGESSVQADGTFTVQEPSTGLALVTLNDPSGNTMLMGYVDAADPQMGRISPLSTATVLMFFGIGGYTLPAENWKETLALIEAEQKVKDLAAIIEQRLAVDSAALQNSDQAIMDAVTAACAALNASGNAGGSGTDEAATSKAVLSKATDSEFTVAVSKAASSKDGATTPVEIMIPDSNLSGVQVSASPNSDAIFLTNSYRRHCWYWVYYTGYQDKSGTDHLLSTALWELKDNGYLKSTNALGGVVGTSIDFAWGKIPYIPVKVGPITLDTMPADAQKAYYKVVLVGGTTFINYLPPAWVTENVNSAEYIKMQNLMGQITIVKDYLVPTLFAFIPVGKLNGFNGKQLGDFAAGMIGILVKGGVNVTLNAVDEKYSDICWTILKAVLSEGSIRNGVCEYVGTWLLGAVMTEQAVKDVGTTAKFLAEAIKSCDKVLLGIDLGAVSKDIAMSDGYECFDVIAVKPVVHIEPGTATITAGSERTFTAIKGTVTGDTFEYHWSITGQAGSLRKSDGSVLSMTQTTSEASIVYQALSSAEEGARDTLSVDVYRKQITESGVVLQLIGSDQIVITISKTTGFQLLYREQVLAYDLVNDGDICLFNIGYFILKKIPGAATYEIALDDHGFPYIPPENAIQNGLNVPSMRIGSHTFLLSPGGWDDYGSGYGNGIVYLIDKDNQGSFGYYLDLVPIADDEVLLVVGCNGTTWSSAWENAEQKLRERYANENCQGYWDTWLNSARYWTVTCTGLQ